MPAESLIFDPTPEAAEQLLGHLGTPDLSFHEIAARHRTTAPALAAWMARPDIAERIARIQTAAIDHTRLAATTNLGAATVALVQLLRDFTTRARTQGLQSLGSPTSGLRVSDVTAPDAAAPIPSDPIHHHLRESNSALRAASLLFRIARFTLPTGTTRPTQDLGLRTKDPSTQSVPRSNDSPPAPLDLDALAALLDQRGVRDSGTGFQPVSTTSTSSTPAPCTQPAPVARSEAHATTNGAAHPEPPPAANECTKPLDKPSTTTRGSDYKPANHSSHIGRITDPPRRNKQRPLSDLVSQAGACVGTAP